MDAARPLPRIGDLVRLDGERRVVTDIRRGTYILRPVRGKYTETSVDDPGTLTVLARSGTWSP